MVLLSGELRSLLRPQLEPWRVAYDVIMGCGGRQVVYCAGYHQSLQCTGGGLTPSR